MRAYKRTVGRDGDGDDFVEYPAGFKRLVCNIFYFNKLWSVFEEIDTSGDRKIDFGEFCRGLARLEMSMTVRQAEAEFDRLDENESGSVLFDGLLQVGSERHMPVD